MAELRRGALLSGTHALAWLERLRAQVLNLRSEFAPRPYWSQKQARPATAISTDLSATIRRCQSAISALQSQHWFARTLGFDCVDGTGEVDTTLAGVLERAVGKPQLDTLPVEDWTEDDLCDFVEVLHDIAARPIRGWFHDYSGCGWHPQEYDRASGQTLYRWRINEVLDASTLGLRLASEGEDAGRMIRVLPSGLDELVSELAQPDASGDKRVRHAIAAFRRHGASREDRREAVRNLADVLEANRALVKSELLRKDEAALFQIANDFDIRHHNAKQQTDYPDEYLDWLFYWYLATVDLVQRILQVQGRATDG